MEEVLDQIKVGTKFMTTYFNIEAYSQNQTANYMMQEAHSTYLKPLTDIFTTYSANKVTSTAFANFIVNLYDKIEYTTYNFK